MKKAVYSYIQILASGALDWDVMSGSIGAIFIAIFNYWFGDFDFIANLFFYMLAADYATGFIKGILTKQLSSNTGYKGFVKKGGMLIIVGLAFQLDKAFGTSFIRPIIMIGYCNNEMLSIIENGEACGFIPKSVAQFLAQYQKKLSSLTKINTGGE